MLEEIVKHKLTKITTTRWDSNITTARTVYENQEKLMEVFEAVEDKYLRSATFNETSGLRWPLEDLVLVQIFISC